MLLLAVVCWLTGFWWCSGRWEHGLILQWVVLPAFALNADRVWELWKGSFRERPMCLLAILALIEWQFWMTGLRAGEWWGRAGSGKDFALLVVLISALVLSSQDACSRLVLWRGSFLLGVLAVAWSLVVFYAEYGLSEERFRLLWRYEPGFNAVTTGILVGFALLTGVVGNLPEKTSQKALRYLGLAVLGFALAASESRGALLATLVGGGAYLFWNYGRGSLSGAAARLLTPAIGFTSYWAGVHFLRVESRALLERGSTGRFDVYQHYLDSLSGWDWIFGKGEVPVLPAEELGWLVHHTHSGYLGELVAYGVPALVALVVILGMGGWKLRRKEEFPLFAFGLVAVLFDGGLIFSVFSMARWEILVVGVPLLVGLSSGQSVMGRAVGSRQSAESEARPSL